MCLWKSVPRRRLVWPFGRVGPCAIGTRHCCFSRIYSSKIMHENPQTHGLEQATGNAVCSHVWTDECSTYNKRSHATLS